MPDLDLLIGDDHPIDERLRQLPPLLESGIGQAATSVRPVGQEQGWIGQLHRRTDVALGYGLRPREAAVVRGMVLGDRSLMPQQLEKSFQRRRRR